MDGGRSKGKQKAFLGVQEFVYALIETRSVGRHIAVLDGE